MKKKDKKKHDENMEDSKLNNTEFQDVCSQAENLIKDPLEKKQQEYDILWDKYARLQAEFDNFRKRSVKERAGIIKYANETLIMDLLGILDNFERGIKAGEMKKDFDILHQGVDMIAKQFYGLLESNGLKRIVSLGQKFDPHQHEPVEVKEDESIKEDTVFEELQPGYLLNGRIIRPAKVKVHVHKVNEEVKEEELTIIKEVTEEAKEDEDFEIKDNNKDVSENKEV